MYHQYGEHIIGVILSVLSETVTFHLKLPIYLLLVTYYVVYMPGIIKAFQRFNI